MSQNDLTVFLTLRGRHLHTLRWLWHANRIGFPYHVIIADGEVHPSIDLLLSNPASFPNLSFEYHRHCDVTFSDFYSKCAETVRKVRTKYVMMSDNDDFPIMAGIKKSIAFLDNDSEYVCAGGKIPEFSITPETGLLNKITGHMEGPRLGYKYQCHDLSTSSISERVFDEINTYQILYYNVYRTEALRVIFEEIEIHDFSDLTVHEYYCALRTVTLGKVRIDPTAICYFRQTGTSMLSTYFKDWVHHLLRSRLPQDFSAMATAIAREVETIDGNNSGEIRELILDAYAQKIRIMLGHNMMRYRFPRLFQIKQKLLWMRKLHVIPGWYQQKLERKSFWRTLSNDCADVTLLAAYKEEFDEIEASLQGDGLLSFIKKNAPDLLNVT